MKKLLAVLLALGCLCACGGSKKPQAPAPAASTAPAVAYYARSQLNAREQAAYDLLCQRLTDWALGEIALAAPLAGGGIERVWQAVREDRPAFYWADCIYPAGGEPTAAVRLALLPGLTLSQAQARQREISAAAARLLAGVGGSGTERATAIHDRLLQALAYEQGLQQADAGTIYGGLVLGRGVCDAFSRSYQYLMQQAGVPCCYIGGNSVRGIPHSWNAVKLEDGWYYVDVTWDDLPAERGILYHDYLLVTLEEISLDHYADPSRAAVLPPANSDRNNYYRYFGYAVDPAEETDLLEGMAAGFVRQLEDRAELLTERPQPIFLEIKVMGGYEGYTRCRERFAGESFLLLREISRQLAEKNLPIAVETTGQVEYNYNNDTQVLTLWPEASRK